MLWVRLALSADADLPAVAAAVVRAGGHLYGLEGHSLEEVLIGLVAGEQEDAPCPGD